MIRFALCLKYLSCSMLETFLLCLQGGLYDGDYTHVMSANAYCCDSAEKIVGIMLDGDEAIYQIHTFR